MDRTKYMDDIEVRQMRTFAEHRALKDLASGHKGGVLSWMLVDAALSTGLRVSELAALTVGDLDPKRGTLRVTRLKRKLPFTETMNLDLEFVAHLVQFIEWKNNADQPTGKGDPLFMGGRGKLTAQGLQQIWKSAIRRAELPRDLSIHCARHTVATHLLAKTHDLRQVQKQLGHASPETTANMYADVTDAAMREGMTNLYA